MGTIFDIAKKRSEKDLKDSDNLNNLLKRAHHMIKNCPLPSGPILKISSKEDFTRKLESKISQKIIQEKMVSQGMFICGIYVPKVIAQYLSTSPKSWIVTDYYFQESKTKNETFLQQGADICFLICCLFPKRGNWRQMKIGHYQKMGVGFYYRFFLNTGKEVGYHMSDNFNEIVDITKHSIDSL